MTMDTEMLSVCIEQAKNMTTAEQNSVLGWITYMVQKGQQYLEYVDDFGASPPVTEIRERFERWRAMGLCQYVGKYDSEEYQGLAYRYAVEPGMIRLAAAILWMQAEQRSARMVDATLLPEPQMPIARM